MKKKFNVLNIIDLVTTFAGNLGAYLISILMLVMMYEVIARRIFNRPTSWSFETSEFLFGTIVMLGGSYAFLHGAHVNMDAIYGRLKPKGKAILDLITSPLLFIFCGALIWYGGAMALKSFQMMEKSNSIWAPPLFPIKSIVPIGGLLLLIQGIAKFIKDLKIVISKG